METKSVIGQDFFKHVLGGEDVQLPEGLSFEYETEYCDKNGNRKVHIDSIEKLMLIDGITIYKKIDGEINHFKTEKIKHKSIEEIDNILQIKMNSGNYPSKLTYFVLNKQMAENANFFAIQNHRDLFPKITFNKLREAINTAFLFDLMQYKHIETSADPNGIECLKYKNKTLILAVENINKINCWQFENYEATSIRSIFLGFDNIVNGRNFALFTPNASFAYERYYDNKRQRDQELLDR